MGLQRLLLALISGVTLSTPIAKNPVTNVTYQGILADSGTVEYFHRVHYAQDTSGLGRFAPPKPLSTPPEGTIIDATKPGLACPQLQIDIFPYFNKPSEISEDCLSIFIARPVNINAASDKKLPVLAWLHGGGAHYGAGIDPHTMPDKLINLSVELDEPVLFAGINYRLGIFGFAASEELQEQRSQNVGLRDQRLALEWLQQNIATFGGDPDRITAYGLSAGGTTISLQHVAFGGEKGIPFNQAYMMSGPPGTALNQSSDCSKTNTANVAKRLGCPDRGQDMLDCMRNADLQNLVTEAYNYGIEGHPPYGLFTFVPVVDNDFLPEQASKLVRQGKFVKNIPTIIAWTEDDGATNTSPAPLVYDDHSLLEALKPWLGSGLSESRLSELLAAYPASEFEDQARVYNKQKAPDAAEVSVHWYRASSIMRDVLFTCSSIDFAHQMFRQTRESNLNPNFDKIWVYQLNQSMLNPLFDSFGMGYIGAAHGSDTSYIFNGVFPEGTIGSSDLKLSRQFASSLIHFAHAGDPVKKDGGNTFQPWPQAFTEQTKNADENGLMPSDLNLLVIGGPYGSSPVHISHSEENAAIPVDEATISNNTIYTAFEGLQQIVMQELDHSNATTAQRAKVTVQMQRLFKRCTFVNSLAEDLGA